MFTLCSLILIGFCWNSLEWLHPYIGSGSAGTKVNIKWTSLMFTFGSVSEILSEERGRNLRLFFEAFIYAPARRIWLGQSASHFGVWGGCGVFFAAIQNLYSIGPLGIFVVRPVFHCVAGLHDRNFNLAVMNNLYWSSGRCRRLNKNNPRKDSLGSTVSKTKLSEFFFPHLVPGGRTQWVPLSLFWCAKPNSPSLSQNSPSLPQNSLSSITQPQLGPFFVLKFVCSWALGRDCFNRFQRP